MSKFEDHLWTEFVREHGDAMASLSRSTVRHAYRGPRLVAGTGLGLAGLGVALVLVLGGTSTAPAFAVTRNGDGTVTISIERSSGVAAANARLQQLGIRAQVMTQAPAGFRCTSTIAQPLHGARAPQQAIAHVHWTIDPRTVPRGRLLALTPPPGPPPGATSGNSGNSGNGGSSGNSGSGGQVWWSCGTEGPVLGSGPPPSPPGSSGSSGNSGNSGS
jgi:hypothetical protein